MTGCSIEVWFSVRVEIRVCCFELLEAILLEGVERLANELQFVVGLTKNLNCSIFISRAERILHEIKVLG